MPKGWLLLTNEYDNLELININLIVHMDRNVATRYTYLTYGIATTGYQRSSFFIVKETPEEIFAKLKEQENA